MGHDSLAERPTALPRRWSCGCLAAIRKIGDPWHSVTDEAALAHSVGWLVAFPSNAEDAVGLLSVGTARQRSGLLLRTPGDAGRGLGQTAVSG